MDFPVIDVKATGLNLKGLLAGKGVSVKTLVGFLGLSDKSGVYKWFRGETLPTLDNLLALSVLLNMPMNDLLVTM